MTAIDAAVQSRKLGAEEVTIVYRREQAQMPASLHEQQWSQTNGVTIRTHAVLKSLASEAGQVTGATFADVRDIGGRLQETGDTFALAADTVLKAIGQTLLLADPRMATLARLAGRIVVDDQGRTTMPSVWAGGDCTHGGHDLTVEAVEHGKIAAHSIHSALVGAPAFARVRRTAA